MVDVCPDIEFCVHPTPGCLGNRVFFHKTKDDNRKKVMYVKSVCK